MSVIPINSNVMIQSAAQPSAYTNFLLNYLNTKFLSNIINTLVYHADLSLVLPSSNNIEIFNYLKQFINLLLTDLKNQQDIQIPKKHYIILISLIRKLVDIREDVSFSFINYDNLLDHFKTNDQFVTSLLQEVVNNQISSSTEFQKIFDNIIQEIQLYNQMQIIKQSIFRWDQFLSESNSEDSSNNSALNWVKHFKDTIIEANNSLSELTVLKKHENAPDYLMFYDQSSIKESLSNIMTFLKTSYRTYKTGYSLFDDNISGIESSSVMIISGPSNHAKSIFMLNLAKSIMELNDGKNEDTFIFVTLEDDSALLSYM